MRMRIRNETHYPTKIIGDLLRACAEATLTETRGVDLHVMYGSLSCIPRRSNPRLTLPKRGLTRDELRYFTGCLRWICWYLKHTSKPDKALRETLFTHVPEWFLAFPGVELTDQGPQFLALQAAAPAAVEKPKVPREDLLARGVEKRAARAAAMLERAEADLKKAAARVAKWKKKVKYYAGKERT